MSQKKAPALEAYIATQFDNIARDDVMFPDQIDENHWQWRAVEEALQPLNKQRVLDIGCAKGNFSRLLHAKGAKVSGIDISAELLKRAKNLSPEIEFKLGSMTDIPYSNELFGAAICIEVLEHVPVVNEAIAESARVLKSGGKLLIIDKNLAGLHPIWLYPVAWEKSWQERKGAWMYPKDAPFQERWFTAGGLKKELLKSFSKVEVRYLQRERHPLIVSTRKLIPWLAYDILWIATK
jgi:ubiquinone/menaquinone biosynthesis C-methylase UbiE